MNVMKDVLKKLYALYEEECSLLHKLYNVRKQQSDLCELNMVGKCFRSTTPGQLKEDTIKTIFYFTSMAPISFSDSPCLKAICVRFANITDFNFGRGVTFKEESSSLEDCLRIWLDDAELISYEEFKFAFDRASSYLSEELRLK